MMRERQTTIRSERLPRLYDDVFRSETATKLNDHAGNDSLEPFDEGTGLCAGQSARRINAPQVHCRKRPFVENTHHFARFELRSKHPSRSDCKSLCRQNGFTHSFGRTQLQAGFEVHRPLRSATPKEPFLSARA